MLFLPARGECDYDGGSFQVQLVIEFLATGRIKQPFTSEDMLPVTAVEQISLWIALPRAKYGSAGQFTYQDLLVLLSWTKG